jgi:hypothetical protein
MKSLHQPSVDSDDPKASTDIRAALNFNGLKLPTAAIPSAI